MRKLVSFACARGVGRVRTGRGRWLAEAARRFARSRRGGVTTIVGLAIVPTVVGVGAAIDLGRVAAARSALAMALDAAALAAARETDQSIANLRNVAQRFLRANFAEATHGALGPVEVTASDLVLTVRARAEVPTTVMRLAGIETVEVNAETEVTLSGVNLEVALVLDVTGSMAQGTKLADLKAAAKDLLDILLPDRASPFYAKVALVPYSMGVNVGPVLAPLVRGPVSPGTCSTPGCQFYSFTNANGQGRTHQISTCVSERIGAHAYTDAPPTTAPVGRNYPATANPCLPSQLVPLSSGRTSLKAAVDALVASGSTAGHVGVAWGWYTLSPNFGVWTGGSAPAAYGRDDTRKFLVLMTDGEYNSSYCNGVIARSSTTGSGSRSDQINCDAPNGHSFDQARQLCTAIKARGIEIFTVGFQIVNDQRARDLMTQCASSPRHAYSAETGGELRAAFRQIASRMSKLRISR